MWYAESCGDIIFSQSYKGPKEKDIDDRSKSLSLPLSGNVSFTFCSHIQNTAACTLISKQREISGAHGFGFLGMKVDCGAFRIYSFIYTYIQPHHRMEELTEPNTPTVIDSPLGFQRNPKPQLLSNPE